VLEIAARGDVMRRRLLLVLATIIVVAAAALAWRFPHVPAQATSNPATSNPALASRAVPVTAGAAETKDVGVYATGLGTVQAFNTVTVRTRVDGQLDKLAFTEGQDVKTGDVLAQIDPRTYQAQLEQAIAKKQLDEATLANAKRDLDRYLLLLKTNAIPSQQLDTQRALVAQDEAQLKLDQGAIDNARAFVDYCTIRSPLDGRTGIRLVDQGNIVHASDANGLMVITQLQPISVIFTLPEDQLPDVFGGMLDGPLKVFVTARTDDHQLDAGTLELVDNTIDQSTGTIRLKATFPNANHTLWPGQYVNVRLMLRTLPQVVTVPSTAIQRGPDGLYVYVIKPDSTAAMQPVEVRQMVDGTAVIDKGLTAGTRIVVSGQYRLQPGSRVRVAAAPADVADKT
jgi:multidrug efflux system membrane fusion protein